MNGITSYEEHVGMVQLKRWIYHNHYQPLLSAVIPYVFFIVYHHEPHGQPPPRTAISWWTWPVVATGSIPLFPMLDSLGPSS